MIPQCKFSVCSWQTEAAERSSAEERGTERGSGGRSAGGVRELERTGAAPGQRQEDGGGRVREADGMNGERLLSGVTRPQKRFIHFTIFPVLTDNIF